MEREARATTHKAATGRPKGRERLADWHKPGAVAALALVAIGLLALATQYAVRSYHDGVALADKSRDPSPVAVTIAGETLAIPANMIRFPDERRGGALYRVNLALQWPGLAGYSADSAAAFRDGSTLAPLVYVTIAPRDNPLDSDGRLSGVYQRFFTGEPIGGPSGLTGRRMTADSGYRGEEIYYSAGAPPFAARCLAEATGRCPPPASAT